MPNIAINLNKQAMGNRCEDILWHRKPHSHFWVVASTDLSTRCISAWSNSSSLILFQTLFFYITFNIYDCFDKNSGHVLTSECPVIRRWYGGVTSTIASKNDKKLNGWITRKYGKAFLLNYLSFCLPTNNRFVEILDSSFGG